MKKKRFCFSVKLELLELNSVPYVNGTFFAKLRQIDGGDFSNECRRVRVENHRVVWSHCSNFQCKMQAPLNTGVLEQSLLRVSVRKEAHSGKVEKIGYVDLDLAQFCGMGATEKRCIIFGYDSKRRQDNSILKLRLTLSLMSGDPVYKRPSQDMSHDESVDPGEARGGVSATASVDFTEHAIDTGHAEIRSSSSSPKLQSRPTPTVDVRPDSSASTTTLQESGSAPELAAGNGSARTLLNGAATETSASLSVRSMGARRFDRPRSDTAGALTYNMAVPGPIPISASSRSVASGVETLPRTAKHGPGRGHARNASWDPGSLSLGSSTPSIVTSSSQASQRVASTRFDAEAIVASLLKDTENAATAEDSDRSDPGLQLFVNRGGNAVVSGRSSGRHLDRYTPVTLNPRS